MHIHAAPHRTDQSMTEGSIFGHLLRFSLPLLLGNFCQQLYNTVDSIVVGNFVGKEALAAVGTVNPIINTLIGLFLGLSTGVSVVIAQAYGARDAAGVRRAENAALHTKETALRPENNGAFDHAI